MRMAYAWLWSYWGVLVFVSVVGWIAMVGGTNLEEKRSNDTGLSTFGLLAIFCTLIFGILWAIIGPFSIHWILVPAGVLAVFLTLIGRDDDDARDLFRGGILVATAIVGAYAVTYIPPLRAALAPSPAPLPEGGARFTSGEDGWWHIAKSDGGINGAGGGLPRVVVRDFWPGRVVTSLQGFLATPDGSAVRVLASGYLTPVFDSSKTEFPGGVVGVMKPYRAYYVVRKQEAALMVTEPPYSAQSSTVWVRQSDCYAWTTGQAAEVRGALSIYASDSQARTSSQPLTPQEKYTDISRLVGIPGATGAPPMTRLPVLLRAGNVAALLCPAYGGQLCWVNMATTGDSIVVSETR